MSPLAQAVIHFPMKWMTTIALMIFFTFFMSMLVMVLRKSRQSLFQKLEMLPLQDSYAENQPGDKYE